MKISEDPAEMLQKTATWKEDDFQECYPRRGWKFTDGIRKFFRRDSSPKKGTNPQRASSSRGERAHPEHPRETRSSGSQTPEVNTTPRRTQTTRERGRQLVSSERIESRRARTQDGDTQTRGRPLVRQRMRTESVSVPRPETRESGTHPPPIIVESRGSQEPDEYEFPSPSAPTYEQLGIPSAPPADRVLTPPMVTPPESPEHFWDPLPMPDGYLPDPTD